ncbi:MAG: AAA family ATPase, partial [Verrucomicrobiota bacterium]
GRYSGGQQRKAAILLALAPRPEVILLDEPAAGLDPIARRELINELVAELARGDGCTVLFSTHIITDLERIAEHVGIMDRGRLLLNSRLDELQASSRRIQVIFPGDEAPETFCIPGAMRQETAGPVVTAITRVIDPQFLDSLRRRPGVRVNLFPIGLEELFVELFNSPEESIPAFESGDDFDSAQTNFESGRNT